MEDIEKLKEDAALEMRRLEVARANIEDVITEMLELINDQAKTIKEISELAEARGKERDNTYRYNAELEAERDKWKKKYEHLKQEYLDLNYKYENRPLERLKKYLREN